MDEAESAEPENSAEESEKRRDLRIPLRVLRVEARDSRRQEIFFGYASNISVSGLYIQTPSPKDRGTQFHLTFTLPTATKDNVTLTAEVAWVKNFAGKGSNPGMGLKFIDLNEETKALIRKFVETNVG